jgi:hypothetical protein
LEIPFSASAIRDKIDMRAMTEDEFNRVARPLFRAVFDNNDPFDAPFQSHIQPRLLLYGFRWVLHEPWLTPIVEALTKLDEDGFYLTELSTMFHKSEEEIDTEPYHWFVPLAEAGIYKSEFGPYANAMCSIKGSWGLVCSYEDHAVIGGSSVLIDAIRVATPDLDARIREFLDVWKHYHERNKADISWLPRMLAHIYGPEASLYLLEQAQLKWLFGDDPVIR